MSECSINQDFLNSSFCSMVCVINPRNAAHLLLVELDCDGTLSFCVVLVVGFDVSCVLPATSCAIFSPNLSLSSLSSFSLRLVAPGRLFMDFCRIFPSSDPPCPSSPISCKSGRASANPSRVVASFLFGRLRFKGFLVAFSMRFTNAECFMTLLSFLEFMKLSDIWAPSRCTGGRAINLDPDFGVLVFERIEGRFLGAVGA
jgi:hypothetical protein